MKQRFWLIGGLLVVALLLLLKFMPQQPGSGMKESVWRGWPGMAAVRPYALAQDFLQERGIELVVDDQPRGEFPPADKDALLLEKNSKRACATGWKRVAFWYWKAGIRRARSLT